MRKQTNKHRGTISNSVNNNLTGSVVPLPYMRETELKSYHIDSFVSGEKVFISQPSMCMLNQLQ